MNKGILAVLFLFCIISGTASAQTCTIPNTLTNGTPADATVVMANFNAVAACVNTVAAPSILQGWIAGLTMSNDTTTPYTVIDTSAGTATSDDVTTSMKLAAFAKNANAAWAVGNGNGCLDSASILGGTAWYHLYVIERTDTGVVDELCVPVTAPAPTMPTGYTKKRRIGSFKTDGSTPPHILAFVQNGDEFLWVTSAVDASSAPLSTTTLTQTLTVPPGVQVNALFRARLINAAASGGVALFTSFDEADQTATSATADMSLSAITGGGQGNQAGRYNVRTNLGGQIRVKGNISGLTYSIGTFGWVDTRGRFN